LKPGRPIFAGRFFNVSSIGQLGVVAPVESFNGITYLLNIVLGMRKSVRDGSGDTDGDGRE